MSIPYAGVISVDTATARLFPLAPTLRDLLSAKIISGRTLIYLYMLVAYGDLRGHGPYLRSLPTVHDDPLWWSEDELAELNGTNLVAAIEERRRALKRAWDALVPLLHGLSCPFGPPTEFTWERFLWAHSCFTSRAFPQWLSRPPHPDSHVGDVPDDDPMQAVGCLLPVLDTLNHRYRARITWVRHGDRLAFVTEDAVPPNSAVANNYGPKSNEELLLGYGFVLDEPPNPHETVSVRFGGCPVVGDESLEAGGGESVQWDRGAATSAIARWANYDSRHVLRRSRAAVARLDALHATAAFTEEAVTTVSPDVRGSLPPDFLPFLRLLALPDAALRFLWQAARHWRDTAAAARSTGHEDKAPSECACASFRASFIRSVLDKPLDSGHERQAIAAGIGALLAKQELLAAVRPWLRSWGQEFDKARAHASDSRRTRMARALVLGQWEVLSDAVAELRSALPVIVAPVYAEPAAPALSLAAIPVIAPALAAVLASVDGLELRIASVADGAASVTAKSAVGDSADVDDSVERMQLTLFVLHQRAAGEASPWHRFLTWAARRYNAAVLNTRADAMAAYATNSLEQRSLCAGRRAMTEAAVDALRCAAIHSRETLSAATSADADDVYSGLFPALSKAAPRVFPRRMCTRDLGTWATLVVDAECRPTGPTGGVILDGGVVYTLDLPRAVDMAKIGSTESFDESAQTGMKRQRAKKVQLSSATAVECRSRGVEGGAAVGNASLFDQRGGSGCVLSLLGALLAQTEGACRRAASASGRSGQLVAASSATPPCELLESTLSAKTEILAAGAAVTEAAFDELVSSATAVLRELTRVHALGFV